MTKNSQVEQEESLTPEEHLEAILFQFVNLYERWSEDRQVTAKQSADLAKFIKEFAQQVNKFATLEERVRNDIHTSMRTEAENMAVYLGQTIGEAARKQIAPTVKKLEEASDEARDNLVGYYRELSQYKWVTIGVAALTTILTSLLIVKLLMPTPVMPLTAQQLDTYESGEAFQLILSKLSTRQKQWLFDVAKGKAKNHEKLSEDMKKDYSTHE
ncbi:hypothetical protein [Aquicella lusitana]|uniref:Uncharacterized protein n=1 Tax=Aquicella lusitana TaxID=254246 RepID=A0A370G293_9COXI|nr:hypothetical protein [Aquicella lusitana]RDI37987.1 hypothetical protein C8D86_13513 [Aquicella lusitana]VVC74724.1 hypothetical protein AQULUS_24900 [Aquicella lusitana]